MLACSCLSCRMSLGSSACVRVDNGLRCWVPEDEKCKKDGVFQLQAVYARLQLWNSKFEKLRTPHTAGPGSNPTVPPSLIYREPDMADYIL